MVDVKLSDRERRVLTKINEAPDGGAISFTGHNSIAGHKLARRGLAVFVGYGKATQSIFQPTDAGRAAIHTAEHS